MRVTVLGPILMAAVFIVLAGPIARMRQRWLGQSESDYRANATIIRVISVVLILFQVFLLVAR